MLNLNASNLCLVAMALSIPAGSVAAQSLTVSMGVRETNSGAAIGDNGGFNDGIEFVDLDNPETTLDLDGSWQTISWDLANAPLTAFAGTTADGAWSPDVSGNGTLEHLRFLNAEGITAPIQLYIDDLMFTPTGGSPVVVNDFESFFVDELAVFRRPAVSGSTAANLVEFANGGPDISAVTDLEAQSGTQSLDVQFQFIDDTPTNWLRLTTFDSGGAALLDPNSAIPFDGVFSVSIMGMVESDGLSADFNGDGTVDLLDLDILGSNWQMAGDPATGDANGDGNVDLLDLDLLGSQWQQSASFAAALGAEGILSADFNIDGIINDADLAILAENWEQIAGLTEGDIDGSGFVDLVDLDLLGQQWTGDIAFAAALSAAGITVPQPGVAVMLLPAALAAFRRRRQA